MDNLLLLLEGVNLNGEQYHILKKVRPRFLYHPCQCKGTCRSIGVTKPHEEVVENKRMPMKLKSFMWLAFQNRLQTETALKKKALKE